MFEQTRVFPIDPTPTSTQESKFIENNKYLKNEHQFTYHNINGLNHPGCNQIDRIRLSFESEDLEEITFTLNLLIALSNNDPKKISLKNEYNWLIDYLIKYLNFKTDLNIRIDCSLIIRNLIQDIDNCQIVSLNFKLREILIEILKTSDNRNFFNFDQFKELIKYTLDIIESISSYLSPVRNDDEIFVILTGILNNVQDKNIIITILRSLSRLLYNSNEDNDASDLISGELLDKIIGFLILSINKNQFDDELILTSLDFLIQFINIKESNLAKILSNFNNSNLLENFLPKLLIYKQDFKTEFSQQQLDYLKLYKRVKSNDCSSLNLNKNILIPTLSKEFLAELNKLNEPQRATTWMRCCFRPIDSGEVTQIELWRSYEKQFEKKNLLPAVDFIKNVQHAFPNSKAMVINLGNNSRKFIIKGIEPRFEVVDIENGKLQALNINKNKNNDLKFFKPELTKSEQIKFELFNYGFNDYLKLNEINISTVLLIREIIKYNDGLKLFDGHKEEFIDYTIKVPDLLSYIYEIIDSLNY